MKIQIDAVTGKCTFGGLVEVLTDPGYAKRTFTFLSSIRIDAESECWIWEGSKNPSGYGEFSIPGNHTRVAHRCAWLLFRGDIPEGFHIHHKCEVHACVNPDHLLPVEPGDHATNFTPTNITYLNARKDVCDNGHPLTGDNVYQYPGSKKRKCRQCSLNSQHRVLQQRREEFGPELERTVCRRGHDITDVANVYLYKGVKTCRICHAVSVAAFKARLALNPKPAIPQDGRGLRGKFRTHCKKGHLLQETRIWVGSRAGGSWTCEICYKERTKRLNDKKLAAAHAAGSATRGVVCRRGHDLKDPENTYTNTSGYLVCRSCQQEGKKRRKEALKLQALELKSEEK